MKSYFKEDDYQPASVFELLPFLIQFPEFIEIRIVALKSYIMVEHSNLFHLYSNGQKYSEIPSFSFMCFSDCCFEFQANQNFYVLGVKK